MKTLLVDVGNSRIKWGIHEGGTVFGTETMQHSTIQELGFEELTSRVPSDVDAVFVCNVAGEEFSTQLSAALAEHCDCDVHFARSESQAHGVSNGYRSPGQLGVDRWVAMIAARVMCESYCVVVDAGTAITIDAMNDNGQHLGGQILPGLKSMTESLATSTSDLPSSIWQKPVNGSGSELFARDTIAAIKLGAISATVGAVERSTRILRSAGFEPTTIVTGGDAQHILEFLEEGVIHRPHLVLEGLARIVES